MADNTTVPIRYSTYPVEVTNPDGTKTVEYRKYHGITTGNAVVVKDKEGNRKALNKVLREHEAEISALEDGVESESADSVAEDADASLVTDALRKTPQVLTDAEKSQSRENIGAASAQELATLGSKIDKLGGNILKATVVTRDDYYRNEIDSNTLYFISNGDNEIVSMFYGNIPFKFVSFKNDADSSLFVLGKSLLNGNDVLL